MTDDWATTSTPSPLPDEGGTGLGGFGVEVLLIVISVLLTGLVSYFFARRQRARDVVSDAAAREHQAQLDREPRESERNEEDRRRLVETVKGLFVELQTLGARCAQWAEPEVMTEVRTKWSEDLRPRVVDLSLMPQAGNRRAQKIAERLLREYEDLTHKAASDSVMDKIEFDSQVEKKFVEDLENHDQVKLYVKLPDRFKVDTPIGKYNPDWAIVMEERDEHGHPTGNEHCYLVRETKGSTWQISLRTEEKQKIACGKRHFEDALGVSYEVISEVDELTCTPASALASQA